MPTKSSSIPSAMRPIYETITSATDEFCAAHLDAEYAQLCREMTAALCRKRPSPLERGRPNVWACAITYALGRVNFLFDKSQTPHLSAAELCKLWGVSQASASPKSTQILDALGITMMDTRWLLPSKMANNPLVWLLSVNGMPMDIRDAPREAQEEAFRKGLIPYIPADGPPA